MSKPMKKAYKAVVQSYINRFADDRDYDHYDKNQTRRVDGYALSDVDGDGKAEMLDGHLHAYPGKKGVYFFAQDHGIFDLEKGVIKMVNLNGRLSIRRLKMRQKRGCMIHLWIKYN